MLLIEELRQSRPSPKRWAAEKLVKLGLRLDPEAAAAVRPLHCVPA